MDEKTINALCEKFHTTMEDLIPVYSHYMIHKDVGIMVVGLILMIVGVVISLQVVKKTKGKDIIDWSFSQIMTIIVAGSLIFVIAIVLFFSIYDLILWITSPEMRFLDVVVSLK